MMHRTLPSAQGSRQAQYGQLKLIWKNVRHFYGSSSLHFCTFPLKDIMKQFTEQNGQVFFLPSLNVCSTTIPKRSIKLYAEYRYIRSKGKRW
jgi:hypothetical protein